MVYVKDITVKIIGKTEEPKFFGGRRYKIAYQSIDKPEISGSRVVDFATYCKSEVGNEAKVEVFSGNGVTFGNSRMDATVEDMLRVYFAF